MRPYLAPDAFVSPPRCVRFSTQMRLRLLPDALKSIGLELRRIMRPSSTVEARKRWQRKPLRNAVLENRISELQECFGFQGFWDWQKVHGVKDWRHLDELHPKPTQVKAKPVSPSVASTPRPVRPLIHSPTASQPKAQPQITQTASSLFKGALG